MFFLGTQHNHTVICKKIQIIVLILEKVIFYSQRHVSEGMALVGGPLVEMLNYCTAAKFEGFEAAESE